MKPFLVLVLLWILPGCLNAQTVDSTRTVREVDSLVSLIKNYPYNRISFDSSLQITKEARDKALNNLGKNHPAYATTLYYLGLMYTYNLNEESSEEETLSYCRESVSLRAKLLGTQHPDYAKSLILLARQIVFSSLAEAEQMALDAKTVLSRAYGNNHLEYAGSLIMVGFILFVKGQYKKAEQALLEAKVIFDNSKKADNYNYDDLLNLIATIYFNTGRFEESEKFYKQLIDHLTKNMDVHNPYYTTGFVQLANLYNVFGRLAEGEALLLRSKKILERENMISTKNYRWILRMLAVNYHFQGRIEEAEFFLTELLNLIEKNPEKEGIEYIGALGHFASICVEAGRYSESERVYKELLNFFKKNPQDKRIPNHYLVLFHAYLLINAGKKLEAVTIIDQALQVDEKEFEKEFSFDQANYFLAVAYIYMKLERLELADTLLTKAMGLIEKTFGKEHNSYTNAQHVLANVYLGLGRYQEAELLLRKVKANYEKTNGKEKSSYLIALAHLFWRRHQFDSVKVLLNKIAPILQADLIRSSRYYSEREQSAYIRLFNLGLSQNYSFVQLLGERASSFSATCYNQILFQKGFLLQSVQRIHRVANPDSLTQQQFHLLKSYHWRLAKEYAKPLAEQRGVKDLEIKANILERELVRRVNGYEEALRQVNWKEVQQRLKENEAALELVRYRFFRPDITDSIMYAALLIRPGDAAPLFFPLFEEKQLDSLLQSAGKQKLELISNIYRTPSKNTSRGWQNKRKANTANSGSSISPPGIRPSGKPTKSLYQLLFSPLSQALQGIQTIYYSPAGLLHRINLSAIPIDDKTTLDQRYHLVQVGSTRNLVSRPTVPQGSNEALLYGGIYFDTDSTALAASAQRFTMGTASNRGELSFKYADTTARNNGWAYLKWTEKEIKVLEPILNNAGIQTKVLQGYAATEESFKAIGKDAPSPRVLHLATHGFFFPDPKDSLNNRRELFFQDDKTPIFKISDHPMIRSGLILAGGNRAWQKRPALSGLEDGILTAYEISQMNLSNTELVVLSACETGLGDIKGNEGVYGLQRAFKIAGARYLIMSLWQVPDFQTQELMTTFYKKWLDKGLSIPEAFRAAQAEMRDKYPQNPYLWAGFVLVE